jgi:hypothetical protein
MRPAFSECSAERPRMAVDVLAKALRFIINPESRTYHT